MKVKSICRVLFGHFLLVVAFSLLTTLGIAQGANFDIKISSRASVFVVGSPVRVDIAVANHTDQVLFVPTSRCGAAGLIILTSRKTELAPRKSLSLDPIVRPCGFALAAPPHRVGTESIDANRWFDLSEPGRYYLRIQKRIVYLAETQESNTLVIDIVEAKDR